MTSAEIIRIPGTMGADAGPLPALPSLPVPSLPPLERVREFVRASKEENTLRGYNCRLARFLRVVRRSRSDLALPGEHQRQDSQRKARDGYR